MLIYVCHFHHHFHLIVIQIMHFSSFYKSNHFSSFSNYFSSFSCLPYILDLCIQEFFTIDLTKFFKRDAFHSSFPYYVRVNVRFYLTAYMYVHRTYITLPVWKFEYFSPTIFFFLQKFRQSNKKFLKLG